jgi:4-amino-4-deoxychorismate lyase
MILINGQENNQINVSDRGLQYGDGLFETIEVLQGKPVFFKEHLQRLTGGCVRLKFPPPDINQLYREVEQVCAHADNAVLKIIVTRGQGGRGYRQPDTIQPTRIISLHPFPDYPASYRQQGVAAIFCQTRLGINTSLAGIKHLNRLEQVLARAELSDQDIQEGIMLDNNDHVIEGTMSNLFYVKNSNIYTSPIVLAGVAGVMREIIIKIIREIGHKLTVQNYGKAELLNADECFFCNALIGIWPIRQIEQTSFTKGSISTRLQGAIEELKQQGG